MASDIFAACRKGNLDVVKRILQNKPSLLNSRGGVYGGGTLLHEAGSSWDLLVCSVSTRA